ncbi:hypothetical protein BV20DRAFT_1057303 [Pilatotrama ljubarskyi]|nr:hypothetical protein BV20DRAFT_1057303 [Pilatotrama ljubarskyi]
MSVTATQTHADQLPSVPVIPKLPSLDNSFGAFLIATFIGLMMYGLTIHQSYRYYRLFPRDAMILRMIVTLIVVLETVHVILCMHICYYYLVSNYSKPTALLEGVWSIRVFPLLTALIVLTSESFFTRRVYLIGRQFRAVVVAPVLMLFILAFATAATVEAFIKPTFADFDSVAWMSSAGFGFAVLVDSLLTGTLILVLRKSRTGFRKTDSLIGLMIVYAVNTGLLTGILDLVSFIFAIVFPDNLIYAAFNVVAAKLNSRESLRVKVQRDCFGSDMMDLTGFKETVREGNNDTEVTAHKWNLLQLATLQGISSSSSVVDIKAPGDTEMRGDLG